jgi:hypothetical protein
MAVEVIRKKESGGLQKILPIAGGIVGGIYGGPGGAQAGYTLGGAAAGMLDKDASNEQKLGSAMQGMGAMNSMPSASDGGAMSRRLNGGNADIQAPPAAQGAESFKQLDDARVALASQPPDVRQQYEAPIMAAWLKARREQGVV